MPALATLASTWASHLTTLGNEMREYHYVVDYEGRIIHDATELVDPATLRFFLRAMKRTADDRWLVICQNEQNWFETLDTPFVVRRLRFDRVGNDLRAVELCFVGDLNEPLDPATLESEGGMLYCHIRNRTFRARFGRVAMQQLGPFLTEHFGAPALMVDGRIYPIAELTSAHRD
jgi:hypothetical protein